MYRNTIQRLTERRNGVYHAMTLGGERTAALLAVVEDDHEQPWVLYAREDRIKEGHDRPHVTRLFVTSLLEVSSEEVTGTPDQRRALYEQTVASLSVMDTPPLTYSSYYLEGGRELNAFLARQKFMVAKHKQDNVPVPTDWDNILDCNTETS